MISDDRLLAMARDLLEADDAQYLAAAGSRVARVLGSDDVVWLESHWTSGRFVVWRTALLGRDRVAEEVLSQAPEHPAVRHYVKRQGEPSAQRLSDLDEIGDERHRSALQTYQGVLGRDQLGLVTELKPLGAGRAWIAGREGGQFDDECLLSARRLLPLLLAFDRIHLPPLTAEPLLPTHNNDGWSQLTRRERQVVELLSRGLTIHAMGRVLGISPRTVGKHLENSYRKVGTHDRLLVALHRATTQGVELSHPHPDRPPAQPGKVSFPPASLS